MLVSLSRRSLQHSYKKIPSASTAASRNNLVKSLILSTTFLHPEIIKMSLSTSSDPASSLPPRKENDSMGEMSIEAGKLWGAQTQRSLGNFPIGGPESKSEFFIFYSCCII